MPSIAAVAVMLAATAPQSPKAGQRAAESATSVIAATTPGTAIARRLRLARIHAFIGLTDVQTIDATVSTTIGTANPWYPGPKRAGATRTASGITATAVEIPTMHPSRVIRTNARPATSP